MNTQLLIKPVMLTLAVLATAIYFLMPESAIAGGLIYIIAALSVLFEHMGYGLLMSVVSFLPVFIIAGVSFLLLVLSGRAIYRWSLDEQAHFLLRKMLMYRNGVHLLGFLVLAVIYSSLIHLSYNDSIRDTIEITMMLFSAIEVFFFLFIFSYAQKALSLAKKDLPNNSGFSINTTLDSCWIYSSRGNKTYRTTLKSNKDGTWKSAHSYGTSEDVNRW